MGRKRLWTILAAAIGLVVVVAVFVLWHYLGEVFARDIGKEKAVEAALEDARLHESDITRLRVERGREDGKAVYEIQFTAGDKEYEYEILASSGDIYSSDYEIVNSAGQTAAKEQNASGGQNEQSSQSASNEQSGENAQESVQITMEEATELVLKRVPGSSSRDVEIELDYDHGIYKYEGDIIYEGKEYDFEIDAKTGDFLEWKEERG